MNKEQEKLVDEAYENYFNVFEKEWIKQYDPILGDFNHEGRPITKEEFIDKCKTDTEFSEKWGLKIEERELNLEERYNIALPIWKEQYGPLADMMVPTNVDNTPFKIPTRLITVTYNDKTIENYE